MKYCHMGPFYKCNLIDSNGSWRISAGNPWMKTVCSQTFITFKCFWMSDTRQLQSIANTTVVVSTLRSQQNGCHFADDIFNYIFLKENLHIQSEFHWNLFLSDQLMISQHQLMAWRCTADKPLAEAMMNQFTNSLMHHYSEVIMSTMASQITVTTIYTTICSGTDQRKHQSSASLVFVRGPVNSPHKGPVIWKMFPFDDVIMYIC